MILSSTHLDEETGCDTAPRQSDDPNVKMPCSTQLDIMTSYETAGIAAEVMRGRVPESRPRKLSGTLGDLTELEAREKMKKRIKKKVKAILIQKVMTNPTK